jgi:hypothetical protein
MITGAPEISGVFLVPDPWRSSNRLSLRIRTFAGLFITVVKQQIPGREKKNG